MSMTHPRPTHMPDQFPDHAVPVASALLHPVGVVSNQAQPVCKQGRQMFVDEAWRRFYNKIKSY